MKVYRSYDAIPLCSHATGSLRCSLSRPAELCRSPARSLACPLARSLTWQCGRLRVRRTAHWNLTRMENQVKHLNPDLLQPSKSIKRSSSSTITLNVGGHLYAALRQTLAKHQGSLLEEIANGKKPVQHVDSMGNTFIDRDGHVFRHVLNFLRLGELLLPNDFKEAGLLRREAEFYHLGALVQAVREWEQQQAARQEPAFLEVTDTHERSQGLKVYCSDPNLIEAVKGRLVQVSKSRLDGFPKEFEVSPNTIQFRHFIKSETGSRLIIMKDSTFVCTPESLKLEIMMLALRGGYRLLTSLDSSHGSAVQCEALHFVK
ncbi:BTB/POZ domain-containing protein KCTD4-like [Scleropages formosus]|nr:BTB/POZ domain-containing protein KCTD4 [Scleropages formosus]